MSKLNVTTSTTRPASPNIGSIFFETDTNKLIFWDGTVWHMFDRDSVTAAAPNLVGGYLDMGGNDTHSIGDYMMGGNYVSARYKQIGELSTSVVMSLAFSSTSPGGPDYGKLTAEVMDPSTSYSGQDEIALTWYYDSSLSVNDFINATSSMVDGSDYTTPVAGTYIEMDFPGGESQTMIDSSYFTSIDGGLGMGTRYNFPTPTEE